MNVSSRWSSEVIDSDIRYKSLRQYRSTDLIFKGNLEGKACIISLVAQFCNELCLSMSHQVRNDANRLEFRCRWKESQSCTFHLKASYSKKLLGWTIKESTLQHCVGCTSEYAAILAIRKDGEVQ